MMLPGGSRLILVLHPAPIARELLSGSSHYYQR